MHVVSGAVSGDQASVQVTDGRQGRAPGFWGQLASNSNKNVKGTT